MHPRSVGSDRFGISTERGLFVCQGLCKGFSDPATPVVNGPALLCQAGLLCWRRGRGSAFAPEQVGDLFGQAVSGGPPEPDGDDYRAVAAAQADQPCTLDRSPPRAGRPEVDFYADRFGLVLCGGTMKADAATRRAEPCWAASSRSQRPPQPGAAQLPSSAVSLRNGTRSSTFTPRFAPGRT